MAITIARLSAILGLNSKGFSRGLKTATKSANTFTSGLLKGIGKISAFGAAIAGVAGAASVGALIKRSFSLIDNLAKTADKLGISVQALQKLRFAGKQTGVEVTKLDTAIQRMVRRVAEAAKGTGEARGALAELGVDAAKLARMTPDQMFLEIADAMKQIPTQGDRVRLSFKLFDTEGVALVNTLNQGSEGIRAFGRELDAMGVIVDRFGAAKVEAATDAIAKLSISITGLSNQIAIEAAPAIEEFANRMVEAGKKGGGAGALAARGWKTVITFTARVADVATFLTGAFNGVQLVATQLVLKVSKAIQMLRNVVVKAFELIGIGKLGGRSGKAAGFIDFFIKDLEKASADLATKTTERISSGFRGTASREVERFFKDVEKRSNAAADKVASTQAERLGAATGATVDRVAKAASDQMTRANRSTTFLQGKESRLAFGKAETKAERLPVRSDPEELNLLREIRNVLSSMRGQVSFG